MLEHCHNVIEAGEGLLTSLFLAGLVGGVTHCTGMCGPLVAGQVAARMDSIPASELSEWKRLSGGAVLPYHAGRMTTYALLGMSAALLAGQIVQFPIWRALSASLLILAAMLFISSCVQGTRFAGYFKLPHLKAGVPQWLEYSYKALSKKPIGWRGYFLGMILGLLPCGLVYAAIAAAAASGDVFWATGGMLAFALGTVPALFGVGIGSQWVMVRRNKYMINIGRAVMAVNACMLFIMAGRQLWG